MRQQSSGLRSGTLTERGGWNGAVHRPEMDSGPAPDTRNYNFTTETQSIRRTAAATAESNRIRGGRECDSGLSSVNAPEAGKPAKQTAGKPVMGEALTVRNPHATLALLEPRPRKRGNIVNCENRLRRDPFIAKQRRSASG